VALVGSEVARLRKVAMPSRSSGAGSSVVGISHAPRNPREVARGLTATVHFHIILTITDVILPGLICLSLSFFQIILAVHIYMRFRPYSRLVPFTIMT
jgi:hypothetical protein